MRYDVYVTGYTGVAARSIPSGSSIAVLESPTAKNPLLEQKIVAKVQRALVNLGFRPARARGAEFAVTIQYGATLAWSRRKASEAGLDR